MRDFPAGSSNPRIAEYHAGTNIAGYDDKANWCSSFVHWTLGAASASAAPAPRWRAAGSRGATPLDEPRAGCIAVLWRDDPQSWKGHVGFFLRDDGDDVVLLGGNQLEAVREHRYPRAQVLAYRWPAGAVLENAAMAFSSHRASPPSE